MKQCDISHFHNISPNDQMTCWHSSSTVTPFCSTDALWKLEAEQFDVLMQIFTVIMNYLLDTLDIPTVNTAWKPYPPSYKHCQDVTRIHRNKDNYLNSCLRHLSQKFFVCLFFVSIHYVKWAWLSIWHSLPDSVIGSDYLNSDNPHFWQDTFKA